MRLSRNELTDGREYYAHAADGKKYRGTFVDRHVPGGVFYAVWPAYLPDGKTENALLWFEEA